MWPEKISRSVPQTPARLTSTTTWPGPGSGSGTSRTSDSPGPVMTKARTLAALTAAEPSGGWAGFRRLRGPVELGFLASGQPELDQALGVDQGHEDRRVLRQLPPPHDLLVQL